MPMTPLTGLDRTSSTFKSDVDNFFSTKLPLFVNEANALQTDIQTRQQAAAGSESAASNSARLAGNSQIAAQLSASNAAQSETNAAISAASALNAPGSSATSSTSLTLANGVQNLQLNQTGKAFCIGQTVVITSTANPLNQMTGTITAFNSASAALTVNVSNTDGSGNFNSWMISLSGKRGNPATQQLLKVARTGNVQINASDAGKYFDCSGNFTQTFDPAATLGNGWYIWLANNGNGDLVIANSDGVSNWILYPGAIRIFSSDGNSISSTPIRAGVKTFNSSGTYIFAPGLNAILVQALGAGAGGSSGGHGGGNSAYGGNGGSGGEYFERWVRGIAPGTSVIVTIGAGGVGGPTNTSAASANPGSAGGDTNFGKLLTARGGTYMFSGGYGSPNNATRYFSGHQACSTNTEAIISEFGGGSGGSYGIGGVFPYSGLSAGQTLYGGGGGGGGATLDSAKNTYSGSSGGTSGNFLSEFNGGFGGNRDGGAGENGKAQLGLLAGGGGGGGGCIVNGIGGKGGNGATGAGGGGGGACSTGNSGAGGNGGNGICVVMEIL